MMIEWSELFETKIDLVDQQHKKLFEMLNQISQEIEEGKESNENLYDAFGKLLEYAHQHFVDEEKIMLKNHVDERHISLQRMEHKSFIYDVQRMHAVISLDSDLGDRFEKLVQFIASWLIYHTLRTDQHMAIQIHAIREGQSPEEAYEVSLSRALNSAITNKVLEAVLHLWTDAVDRINYLEGKLGINQEDQVSKDD